MVTRMAEAPTSGSLRPSLPMWRALVFDIIYGILSAPLGHDDEQCLKRT